MKSWREPVVTSRAVKVERVPDGTPLELAAGTKAEITQALGSNFTLHVDGQLVRVAGRDADAIGKPVPTAVTAQAEDVKLDDVKGLVWETLRTCYDPEIPVDIVELGLVYGCELEPMDEGGFRVQVTMTLTAPGCGMGEAIADDACDKLLVLPDVGEATVDVVFDPPWDRSMMSEAAALALGL